MSATPLYRFHWRIAQEDLAGYYYTRWDQAIPVTIIAEDKSESFALACKALGSPRQGCCFVGRLDRIESIEQGE